MTFFEIRDKADSLGGYYDDDHEKFVFPTVHAKEQFDAWMKENNK